MLMDATKHAEARIRQRGIPEFVVNNLVEYGKSWHGNDGADILTFPKAVRQKLKKMLPHREYVAMEAHFDVYAVLQEGYLVTVGHRYKKIPN